MLGWEVILEYAGTVSTPECTADLKCCRHWKKRAFYQFASVTLSLCRTDLEAALTIREQLNRFSTLSPDGRHCLCRAFLMAASQLGHMQVLKFLMGDPERASASSYYSKDDDNHKKGRPPLENLNQNSDDLKRAILQAAKHNQTDCLRFLCVRSRCWRMVTGNARGVRGRGLQHALLVAVNAAPVEPTRYLVVEERCFLPDGCSLKQELCYRLAVRRREKAEEAREKTKEQDCVARVRQEPKGTNRCIAISSLLAMDAVSEFLMEPPSASYFKAC
jgi:hypothetical protein